MKKKIIYSTLFLFAAVFLLSGCIMAGFAFGVPAPNVSKQIVDRINAGSSVDVYLKNDGHLVIVYDDSCVDRHGKRIGNYRSCAINDGAFVMNSFNVSSLPLSIDIGERIFKMMSAGLPVDVYLKKSGEEIVIVFEDSKTNKIFKNDSSYQKLGSYCSGLITNGTMTVGLCR